MIEEEYRERHREYCRKWRSKNKERIKEYKREYERLHPEGNRRRSKRWQESHPEIHNQRTRSWQKTNPDRFVAQRMAYQTVAIKEHCEVCGAKATHRHHEDYSKPLDVISVCAGCHKILDAQRREREKQIAV